MRKERYRQAKAIKKMAEQREQARQDSSGRYFKVLRRNQYDIDFAFVASIFQGSPLFSI
jgi:hypothetical protein